jgi:hypothetical protein
VGVCSYAPSCQALNGAASHKPGGHGACPILKSPRSQGRVHKQQSGSKILFVHDRGGKTQYDSLLSLVLFRYVAPQLQSGVVGLYPVRDAWFLNRLSLTETGHI